MKKFAKAALSLLLAASVGFGSMATSASAVGKEEFEQINAAGFSEEAA